eukprot:5176516-Pleurochrysis_carterae.AAC.4
MAPSEQASEKFNTPTIPLWAVFPFWEEGSEPDSGRPGRWVRAAQAPCRGLGGCIGSAHQPAQ